MSYRLEKDSIGEIKVKNSKLWGAQTQRSLQNFSIGDEKMPLELIYAYSYLKQSCAAANYKAGKLSKKKKELIETVCKEIAQYQHNEHFPLSVWQTGSGTQTNMNLNEVIANRAYNIDDSVKLHPNDDVNMSQSSNDTFPSAMKISSYLKITLQLLPALKKFQKSLKKKQKQFNGIIKTGRTHLQDAVPLKLSDEISGYIRMIEQSSSHIKKASKYLLELPIGATAVGTGLNSPKNFGDAVSKELNKMLDTKFYSAPNKFHALTSHDAEVFVSGALDALAANLMKIANDIRWLGSGPRCGIGELKLPANEPGSSIMPGKVNPTQAEALTMVCVQIMGNHTTIATAASQGNFELNVYKPVIIYNLLQSITLLSDSVKSFDKNCIKGIELNEEKIEQYLNDTLMTVTILNSHIGYENSAKIAKFAYKNNLTLKDAAAKIKILTFEEFDKLVDIDKMV